MNIDMNALPDEMKAVSAKLNKAIQRERKARLQYGLWKAELEMAQFDYSIAQSARTAEEGEKK